MSRRRNIARWGMDVPSGRAFWVECRRHVRCPAGVIRREELALSLHNITFTCFAIFDSSIEHPIELIYQGDTDHFAQIFGVGRQQRRQELRMTRTGMGCVS